MFWGVSAGLGPSLYVILGLIEVVVDEIRTNSSLLTEASVSIKKFKIWLIQLDESILVIFFIVIGLWAFSYFLQRTKNLVEKTGVVLSTYRDNIESK